VDEKSLGKCERKCIFYIYRSIFAKEKNSLIDSSKGAEYGLIKSIRLEYSKNSAGLDEAFRMTKPGEDIIHAGKVLSTSNKKGVALFYSD
jgi:hypothetical protein